MSDRPLDYLDASLQAIDAGAGYPHHSHECVANAAYASSLALIDIAESLRTLSGRQCEETLTLRDEEHRLVRCEGIRGHGGDHAADRGATHWSSAY